MSPQELYDRAGEILAHCDTSGVSAENAAPFVAALQTSIRSINEWLPPVQGTIGYGDGQLMDLIRQLKFHSESTTKTFPNGVHQLSVALVSFRQQLQFSYAIHEEEFREAGNG